MLLCEECFSFLFFLTLSFLASLLPHLIMFPEILLPLQTKKKKIEKKERKKRKKKSFWEAYKQHQEKKQKNKLIWIWQIKSERKKNVLRGFSFGTNAISLSKQKTSKSFLLFKRRISPKTNVNNCFDCCFFSAITEDPEKQRGSTALWLRCIIHTGVWGQGVTGVFGFIRVCDGLARQQGGSVSTLSHDGRTMVL